MGIQVNVKVDLKSLDIANKTEQVENTLAQQALADMTPHVLMRDGVLRGSSGVENNNEIYWATVYARRRFFEPVQNITTPGTTWRWDLAAAKVHGAEWEELVYRAYFG